MARLGVFGTIAGAAVGALATGIMGFLNYRLGRQEYLLKPRLAILDRQVDAHAALYNAVVKMANGIGASDNRQTAAASHEYYELFSSNRIVLDSDARQPCTDLIMAIGAIVREEDPKQWELETVKRCIPAASGSLMKLVERYTK